MPIVRFSNLYLLSQRERRGLKVPFRKPVTVIRAENGMGKSAVAKSLYETFGATPHRVDQPWRGAGVSAAVQFSVDHSRFTMVRGVGAYGVFDAEGKQLISTSDVEGSLAPFLADLLNFHLVMPGKGGASVVPPPAYIFAPYYIDQDGGWSKAWSSFAGMTLPRTRTTLAEFHAGLKPNEYYVAMVERARLQARYQEILRDRLALDRTFTEFRRTMGEAAVEFDVDVFRGETDRLVEESERLRLDQETYRIDLSTLSNERAEWRNHQTVLARALQEMKASFELALTAPDSVECPTCGAHYLNSMAERFGLIENEDGILNAMLHAKGRMREIEFEMGQLLAKLSESEKRTARIEEILETRRNGLTFRDVVTAQSRSETTRVFRQRLDSLASDADRVKTDVNAESRAMRMATSRMRANRIKTYFADRLGELGQALDLPANEIGTPNLMGTYLGRGSAHPRSVLAYFYSFLHTAQKYSTSAYCPIVIDAPNQQGQDDRHMEAIMRVIAHNRPPGSQVIVAAEKLHDLDGDDVDVVEVENVRHGVLREDAYEEVSAFMRPFLGNLL